MIKSLVVEVPMEDIIEYVRTEINKNFPDHAVGSIIPVEFDETYVALEVTFANTEEDKELIVHDEDNDDR